MSYRFKKIFISKILLLGTILLFLLSIIIFLSLTQYKLLMWIILAFAFPIYLFSCFYHLKDYLLLAKINMYQKIDELNYNTKKNIPITILEVIFWISILIISIFFLYIHGFYLVDYEFYYEKAELYNYYLFGGNEPSSGILSQNILLNLIYRPLYPLLITFFSLPLNLFLSVGLSFNVSGVLISIVSGFLTLYFFGKIVKMLSNNKISKRMGRLIIGTTPTFIIFWSKLSTEFLFLLFITISFYTLLKFSKYRRRKDLILFLIASFLTCLVREIGVFLFFCGLGILLKKKKILRALKISAFIFIVILTFILFLDHLITTRYLYWYFYHHVYPVFPDLTYFHFFNFFKWINILLITYFSFALMSRLFFSSLWSFGFFFLLLIIYIISSFIKRIKKNRGNMNNKYFNYINKSLLKSKIFQIEFDLKLFSSFFTPYFLYLSIFIITLISERYFLPIAILLIISFLNENKKEINHKTQTLLIYGVIFNLMLFAIRVIYISIF